MVGIAKDTSECVPTRTPQILNLRSPTKKNGSTTQEKKVVNQEKGCPTQGPAKRQQTMAAHTTTIPTATMSTRTYAGNFPKCDKCNLHHRGVFRVMHCKNCNKNEHTTHFCRTPTQQATQATNDGVSRICYGCGEAGHFKRGCPKARNVRSEGRVLNWGTRKP